MVALSGRRFVVGIDLRKTKFRFELFGRSFEKRRHCPARPAPGRPKIDDHREVAAVQMLVEIARGQGNRLALEQSEVTVRATGCIPEAIARQTNDRIAMAANDMDLLFHIP